MARLVGQRDGGAPDDATGATAESIRRDLCLFDEHTGGAAMSVADPFGVETLGQFGEKARLAWKPLAEAGWLLARRARACAAGAGPGLHVANPAPAPYTGWARAAVDAFREPCLSLQDPATGKSYALSYEAGFEHWGRPQKPEDLSRENQATVFPDRVPRKTARLWVEGLPVRALLSLRASAQPAEDAGAKRPVVESGARGWPAAAVGGAAARDLEARAARAADDPAVPGLVRRARALPPLAPPPDRRRPADAQQRRGALHPPSRTRSRGAAG